MYSVVATVKRTGLKLEIECPVHSSGKFVVAWFYFNQALSTFASPCLSLVHDKVWLSPSWLHTVQIWFVPNMRGIFSLVVSVIVVAASELTTAPPNEGYFHYKQLLTTEWLDRISYRKWRETKLQLIWWPMVALLGCLLGSLHFLCDILSSQPVQ